MGSNPKQLCLYSRVSPLHIFKKHVALFLFVPNGRKQRLNILVDFVEKFDFLKGIFVFKNDFLSCDWVQVQALIATMVNYG